jgi:hypothetical protein
MIKNFCEPKTRVDKEQLWFRKSILNTSRTWCKSKTSKLLQNFGQHNAYA